MRNAQTWRSRLSLPKVLITVFLVGITAFGYHLRFAASEWTVIDHPIRADARNYVFYGFNIKYNHTFSKEDPNQTIHPRPDALSNPAYPIFISMFLDNPPTMDNIKSIVRAQVYIGTFVILLSFLFSKPIIGSAGALIVSALTAISPHLVNAGLYILTETLFSLAICLIFLCISNYSDRITTGRMIFFGSLIALGTLIRPTLLYFPAVVTCMLILNFGLRDGLKKAILLIIGFTIAYSPWYVRNSINDDIQNTDTLLIATLQHGMYPYLKYNNDPKTYGFPYRADPKTPEFMGSLENTLNEIRRRFTEETYRHLKWYLIGKPTTLWSWDIIAGMGDSFIYPVRTTPYQYSTEFITSHRIAKMVHGPLTILALLGSVLVWIPGLTRAWSNSARIAARLFSLTLAYWTALHMVGAPFPRYAVPIRPLLYLCALFPISLGWAWTAEYLRKTGIRHPSARL